MPTHLLQDAVSKDKHCESVNVNGHLPVSQILDTQRKILAADRIVGFLSEISLALNFSPV